LAIPLDTLFPGQVPETTTKAITTTEKAKTVSNSEKRRLYEAALKRCTENGDQMPFYNATQQKYLCYNLLQQGPCKVGEWVTLDAKLAKIGVYFARCFPQKCKNSQNNELIETKNGCEAIYNDANCPPGEELKANPFGKGVCGCKDGFLPHVDEKDLLSVTKSIYKVHAKMANNSFYQIWITQNLNPLVYLQTVQRTKSNTKRIVYLSKLVH